MSRARRAQSLGEYTVITSLVILAVMAMTQFIQRGFAARINGARGYMMTTLGQDIGDIRARREGPSLEGPSVEYEPYYTNKVADTAMNPRTDVFINGRADTYRYRSSGSTVMNTLTVEAPAEDL